MINITGIILIVAGVWLTGTSLIIEAKGFYSKIYFKVIPFFIGLSCLLTGAKSFKWI
jgi:hypothetical protein